MPGAQVGRVLSVEELETSDKLYKVRVQVMNGGEPEERQVRGGAVAGGLR